MIRAEDMVCCNAPERCDDQDCRVRQRWAEERHDEAMKRVNETPVDGDALVCAWCSTPMDGPAPHVPSDLCQRCYDALPGLGVPPVRDL